MAGGLPSAAVLRDAARQARASRRAVAADELAMRARDIAARWPDFRDARPPVNAVTDALIQLRRAADAGDTRADIFHFPSEFCLDRGRAINMADAEWPASLQGLARRWYDLVAGAFRPLGYGIGAEIVTWPQLMPGDVALFLSFRADR